MDQRIAETRPSKSDINLVILDYLISEGYPGAAEKFAQETNMFQSDSLDLNGIRERVRIRNAIFGGRLEEAIEMINEDDAEILDHDPLLHFHLLQLQLIEIIREIFGKSNNNPSAAEFRPALEFATHQLSPRAPTEPKYLDALEKTMALMIFSPEKMTPEMKGLLDLRLRETVAAEVNRAMMTAKGRAPEARIKELVRARAWAEEQAKDARVDLPTDIGIGLDGGRVANGTDGEAMVA